jgi:chromosome segregation ATPase
MSHVESLIDGVKMAEEHYKAELDEAKRLAVYWMDNAEAFHRRLNEAEAKLDEAEAANLGLSVRREEYDGMVERVVDLQEERDRFAEMYAKEGHKCMVLAEELSKAKSRLDSARSELQAAVDRNYDYVQAVEAALKALNGGVVERQSPESELPVLARVVRDDGSSVTIYDGPNSPPSE